MSRARRLATEVRRTFPGSDLSLWAAGATFFGIIGIAPLALASLWAVGALVGHDAVTRAMDAAIGGLPDGHGTPEALRTLTSVALSMSWLQALVVLFPASLYGEGLRRAFVQMSSAPDTLTGWRGRAGLLGVAAVAPFLVLAVLASAPYVGPLYDRGGWALMWGIVVAFHVVWLTVSTALVGVFALIGPGRLAWRPVLIGAFNTGAILAGFLQGFVLFLAIPIPWSAPFGGLPIVGAVSALALWLYLLHILVLCGFRVTVALDEVMRPAGGGRRDTAP
ncbi:membrane protein [Mycolicibacterium rutilum]|uniref:Membrane protein n=1 Tax=Mycolicibacterium rutilum TaxID=370526 RepID=A0A1H6LB61_MYCRU|nr:YihY/virulence factor BrkB family protein [Mycolicibacterium rutilum]SEH85786.1 membrane protein [Mycolicibacterium rutilum]